MVYLGNINYPTCRGRIVAVDEIIPRSYSVLWYGRKEPQLQSKEFMESDCHLIRRNYLNMFADIIAEHENTHD